MPILDPIHLLGLDVALVDNPDYRRKYRRTLLADYELDDVQDQDFLGTTVSKSDVIQSFEFINDSENISYLTHLHRDITLKQALYGPLPSCDSEIECVDQAMNELQKSHPCANRFSALWTGRLEAIITHWFSDKIFPQLTSAGVLLIDGMLETVKDHGKSVYNPINLYIDRTKMALDAIKPSDSLQEASRYGEIIGQKVFLEKISCLSDRFLIEKDDLAVRICNIAMYLAERHPVTFGAQACQLAGLAVVVTQRTNVQASYIERQGYVGALVNMAPVKEKYKTFLDLLDSADRAWVGSVFRWQNGVGLISPILSQAPTIIQELNRIQVLGVVELREKIALLLRNLSVRCWNSGSWQHHALPVLKQVVSISCSKAMMEEFQSDLKKLQDMSQNEENRVRAAKRKENLRVLTKFLIIVGVIGVLIGFGSLSDYLDHNKDSRHPQPGQPGNQEYPSITVPTLPAPRSASNPMLPILLAKINAEKEQAKTMEGEIGRYDQELVGMQSELKVSQDEIAVLKTDGTSDQDTINLEVNHHNELVDSYNQCLHKRNSVFHDYERVIADINSSVDSYNIMLQTP